MILLASLLTIFLGVIAQLLRMALTENMDRIGPWLAHRAARRVPVEEREEALREWLSNDGRLDVKPSTRLIHGLGLFLAGVRLQRSLRQPRTVNRGYPVNRELLTVTAVFGAVLSGACFAILVWAERTGEVGRFGIALTGLVASALTVTNFALLRRAYKSLPERPSSRDQ